MFKNPAGRSDRRDFFFPGVVRLAVLPKPVRVRNPKAVSLVRKPYCELTGRPCYPHFHHIKCRSQGGGDIPENLICLAPEVHAAVHAGKIDRYILVLVVARREKLAPEDVCARIGIPVPPVWPEWEPPETPSLEEVLQVVLSLEEHQDDAKWLQGELLAALMDAGATKKWLATQLRRSVSYIKKRVKTWRAFPDESLRVPELTWEHHRVAASTDDPRGWLERAADEGWSTRDLQLAIARERDPAKAGDAEERRQREAERLLDKVLKFLEEGGPQAKWLRERLLEELA